MTNKVIHRPCIAAVNICVAVCLHVT